jgi:hypothetical protein
VFGCAVSRSVCHAQCHSLGARSCAAGAWDARCIRAGHLIRGLSEQGAAMACKPALRTGKLAVGTGFRLCFADPTVGAAAGRRPMALVTSPGHTTGGRLSFVLGALRGTGARMMRQLGRGFSMPLSPSAQQQKGHRLRAVGAHSLAASSSASTADDLWLEEVDSDRALDWVKGQNKNTFQTLGDPVQSPLYPRLKAIYESKDKIPAVVKRGDYFYNFWQDAENPRGIWRRTSWEEYVKASPAWETLLDVDQLGKDEGQSWVWQGSIPVDLGPGTTPTHCMVQLSPVRLYVPCLGAGILHGSRNQPAWPRRLPLCSMSCMAYSKYRRA